MNAGINLIEADKIEGIEEAKKQMQDQIWKKMRIVRERGKWGLTEVEEEL